MPNDTDSRQKHNHLDPLSLVLLRILNEQDNGYVFAILENREGKRCLIYKADEDNLWREYVHSTYFARKGDRHA